MKTVLSFGEIMVEMAEISPQNFAQSFAGDSFNFAHYLVKAGQGRISASYLSALGDDRISTECRSYIRRLGVGDDRIVVIPDRTLGLFMLGNDASGEKQYHYWRGQSAVRTLFNQPQDLSGYDLVHFSGISAAVTENRQNLIQSVAALAKAGGAVSYDFNFRPKLWQPEAAAEFAEQILPFLSYVKISDEELATLYPGAGFDEICAKNKNAEWVLTCGAEKAECWIDGQCAEQLEFTAPVDVVDTSAAGDSFLGAYLASRLDGQRVIEALAAGHSFASQVVAGKGSIVNVKVGHHAEHI